MSVNDTICKLAQLLGLKDTKEETVLRKRAVVAETVRLNEERLEHMKDEMTDLDGQLRMRKEEYQSASPSIQLVVKAQILNLKKKRDKKVNKLAMIASRIDSGNLLLDKYDQLLFAIKNPATIDEMEDVCDELDGWITDLEQERKVGEKLGKVGTVLESSLNAEEIADENVGDYADAIKELKNPELDAFIASI